MKKIVLLLFLTFFISSIAMSAEFLPRYKDSIKDYGIGLYFGNGKATIYENPTENSKVVADLSWNGDFVTINGEKTNVCNSFAVFLPKNALSGFIAIDEQGEEYTEVIYDIRTHKTGWIKHSADEKAFYWRQLFYKYGKTKGIYIFSNVPKVERVLKMDADIESDISYEILYPKYIRLQLVKGNWALLKVVEFNDEVKVGWFQWRNADGTLNAFPKFDGD